MAVSDLNILISVVRRVCIMRAYGMRSLIPFPLKLALFVHRVAVSSESPPITRFTIRFGKIPFLDCMVPCLIWDSLLFHAI
jgi:hypothetical protein